MKLTSGGPSRAMRSAFNDPDDYCVVAGSGL